MKEIGLVNIRSIKDTGAVPIMPITLLVGENSSGKSSFLRVFPLLKQSIQKKTNGPILWAGDVDDYVDFGSFENAITNDGSEHMGISFSFEQLPNTILSRYYWLTKQLLFSSPLSVKYSIQIEKKGEREYVSALLVELNDTSFSFDRVQTRQPTISVDGQNVSFVPLEKGAHDDAVESYLAWHAFSGRSIFGIKMPAIAPCLLKELKSFSKPTTNDDDSELDEVSFFTVGGYLIREVSIEKVRELINEKKEASTKANRRGTVSVILERVDKLLELLSGLKSEKKEMVVKYIKLLYFSLVYSSIEDYIGTYFLQVHYIAPIRATAERYYRLRNSAIDEVDYQGKNLAIFLNSLPESRRIQFQNWTSEQFGFKAFVSKTEGHLSIEINRTGHAKNINLSDTGFGYSQILPIITQLWELSSHKAAKMSNNQVVPLVVAIEQPELHLHPAMQAKLAESFIACLTLAKENGYALQLILETHSETMINYFGRAIAKGKLKADDIAVILFDRNEDTNQTVTSISSYDNDGYLTNWPIGFFAPGD